jgi:uroporphyrinogen-III synthase
VSDLAPVLAGTRILVTAQRRAEELAGALERRGAVVTITPTLGMVSEVDRDGLVAATRALLDRPADTVVVTTGVGFRGWLDVATEAGLGEALLRVLTESRLVARGPKARGALQGVGLRADWVAESETSAEILERLLAEGVAGERVAIQHHGAGDPAFEGRLAAAGADVLPLQVYRWGPPPDPGAVADAALALAAGKYDAALFTSAPAAQALLAALDAQGVTDAVRERAVDGSLLMAAVGPVTADPLAGAGMRPVHPERSRMGALARLVVVTLGDRS